MKIILKLLTSVALLITAASHGGSVSSKESPQAVGAPKFALLVGVNEYRAGSEISNLSGTHNDVALMKSLLAERGFVEELRSPKPPATAPCGEQTATSAVKTLCSAQATKQAILDAFDSHLIKNAEKYWTAKKNTPDKGPTVVFYYSGHGSYIPDGMPIEGEKESELVKDEADGRDETLVPHDSDKKGSRDIRDDSFDERVRKLAKYTSNIIFISDSCHSGTITRGAGKKGVEREFPTTSGTRGNDSRATDNISFDSSYVTISGSLPTEFSFEDLLPDPVTKREQQNGLLTYHFVHQLRQNPGATYRDIIRLVRTAVTAAGKGQTPQVEGDIDRPVFGTSAAKGKRPIAINCSNKAGTIVCSETVTKKAENGTEQTVRKIKMDVGTIVGARVGGPIDIYSPAATELTGEQHKIGSGTIVTADAFSSAAEVVLSDPKATDLSPLAKVVLVAPMFSGEKRSVAIDVSPNGAGHSDQGTESMRKLAADLQDSRFLKPIETTGVLRLLNGLSSLPAESKPSLDWDVAIVRATYADYKLTKQNALAKASSAADTEAGYFISDRAGNPLYNLWVPASAANASEKLRDALEKHVRAENLRALTNESSPIASKIKVELVRLKDINVSATDDNRCKVTHYTADELKTLPRALSRSDKFTLSVTNASTKSLLLYILSIDSAGEIARIFPPAAGARETLPAGATYSNSGTCEMLFHFDETSPLGRETIKVIATEKELPIDDLTQSGVRGADEIDPRSPLESLFVQAMTQHRSKPLVAGRAADWATVNVEYEVVP